jgi:hypothetical protein
MSFRFNRTFSMMAYPNRSHGIFEGENTTPHLYGLMLRFLKENLAPVRSKQFHFISIRRSGSQLQTKVVAFLTEYAVVDRIIDRLRLTFGAKKPPPSRVFNQVVPMSAEKNVDYIAFGLS